MPPDTNELLKHAGFVRAVARALVGEPELADDIVQETYVAALRAPPRAHARQAWLRRVARNLSLNALRAERRRRARERAAARAEALPSAAEAAERLDTHRRVVDAVHALADPYRATIIYRYFYELSVPQIAARLDVPRETVRTRLRRGLVKLRAMLEERSGGRARLLAALVPLTRKTGVVMGIKAKLAAGAVLLIALAGTIWHLRDRPPPVENRAAAARPVVVNTEEPAPEEVAAVPIDRDLDVHGEVVDASGAPVAGARVAALFFPGRRTWSDDVEHPGPVAQTVADGTFRLRLARDDVVDLAVSADGFAPRRLSLIQAGERLRIVLGPGADVVVNVLDPEGAPLADASVRLSRSWRRGGAVFRREGTTDAQGRCVLRGLPPSTLVSVATHHRAHGRSIATTSIPTDPITVQLSGGRTVSGVVRDRETGAPIAGAEVTEIYDTVVTDADGRYTLEGMSKTPRVRVNADGYAPARVQPGAGATFDIDLTRGVGACGRFVDAAGAPVAAAPFMVFTFAEPQQRVSEWSHGVSGADGSFACRVHPDRVHVLAAFAPGHGRMVLDFEAHEDTDLGTITLPVARLIAGRVVDGDGRPLARVKIEARGANADRARRRGGRELRLAWMYGARDTRYTDDLGRFRFPELPPGVYTLWVEPEGRKYHSETHELSAERDLVDLEVRLPGSRDFTVTVVDEDDRPVHGMFVSLMTRDGDVHGKTGADGVARLTAEKTVTMVSVIDATGQYMTPPSLAVRPDAKDARIVVGRAGTATGTVVGPDGTPLAVRPILDVRRGEEVLFTVVVDVDGTFRAKVPAKGAVDLVLNGQIWDDRRTNISREQFFHTGALRGVTAGAEGLVLRARAVTFDRSVRVRVVTPDGAPADGVHIQVYPTKTEEGHTTRQTDAEGRIEFTGLPARTVAIRYGDMKRAASFGCVPPDPIEQRVLPEGQEVTFVLRAAVRLRGVARLPDGRPAPAVYISTHTRTQFLSMLAFTDAEGRFEVLAPPGSEGELIVQGTGEVPADGHTRRYSGSVRVERFDRDVELKLELQR